MDNEVSSANLDVFALMRDAQSGCASLNEVCCSTTNEISQLRERTAQLKVALAELSATISSVPAGLATTKWDIFELTTRQCASLSAVDDFAVQGVGQCNTSMELMDADAALRTTSLILLDAYCARSSSVPSILREVEDSKLADMSKRKAAQAITLSAIRSEITAKFEATVIANRETIQKEASAASDIAALKVLKEGSPALLAALGQAKAAATASEATTVAMEADVAASQSALDLARKKLLLTAARRDALRRRIKASGLVPVA